MPTDFFGRVMVVFERYGMSMLQGAGSSLKIAIVGTVVGCIIGFAVGIVQTLSLIHIYFFSLYDICVLFSISIIILCLKLGI